MSGKVYMYHFNIIQTLLFTIIKQLQTTFMSFYEQAIQRDKGNCKSRNDSVIRYF